MKKVICNILLVIVSMIAVSALFYFVNGSLEMYPTEEQQEKVRFASMAVFLICLIMDAGLIFLKVKFGGKKGE